MYQEIQSAITALLSVCDGAYSQDGSGFNKIDAGYCRWMASRYPDWTGASAYRAWEILQKYRGQLAGFGIDYYAIPVPERTAPRPEFPEYLALNPRRIALKDGIITVMFPYDPLIVLAVRSIQGAKFDKPTRQWRVPLSIDAAEPILTMAHSYGFELENGTAEGIVAYIEELEKAKEASKATDADISIEGIKGILRPFQRAGVAYAFNKRRAIIGDHPGLGKTCQALCAVHMAEAYPVVVVCPASVKWNWRREAEGWIPGKRIVVLEGTKTNGPVRNADILILNYDILHAWIDKLRELKPQAVVFDEFQLIKEKRSRRSKAAKLLADGVPVRLALSGTPILSRPIELAHPLDVIGRLEEFGGWWRFATRYAAAHRTRFGLDTSGASNLEELNTKLRQVCMVRRRKEDVLPELPDKVRSIIEVDIDNRDEYRAAEGDTIRWLGNRAAKDAAFVASIAHLPEEAQVEARRARALEAGEKAARAEALVRIEALKQLAVKGKMAAIKEWVETFLESDQKLVVFAHHRSVQQELLREFEGAERIFAEDDPQDRQRNVDRFQELPDCRVIICSLQAGGVGITLTAASNVLFTELAWTPAAMEQATDRCHRIGQKDSVTAYWMIGKDTIDVEISDLLAHKAEVVNAATDGAGAVAQESMLKELVEKLIKKGGTK